MATSSIDDGDAEELRVIFGPEDEKEIAAHMDSLVKWGDSLFTTLDKEEYPSEMIAAAVSLLLFNEASVCCQSLGVSREEFIKAAGDVWDSVKEGMEKESGSVHTGAEGPVGGPTGETTSVGDDDGDDPGEDGG